MDAHGIKARIAEFDKRNGGNPVPLYPWFYYANGAVREQEPLGALMDPPANDYARLSNIVLYHKARLTRGVQEFNHFYERLQLTECPSKDEMDHLRKLQSAVGELTAALEAAKAELAATDEGKRQESVRRSAAEAKQRQQEAHTALRAIRI